MQSVFTMYLKLIKYAYLAVFHGRKMGFFLYFYYIYQLYRGFHGDIFILRCSSVRFIPTIVLLHPLPPLLKMVFTGFNDLSSYMHIKHISYFHSRLPSPSPLSHSLTGPVLHSGPSLCKCTFIVQRGFAVVLHM
jgi:hypothetical protein